MVLLERSPTLTPTPTPLPTPTPTPTPTPNQAQTAWIVTGVLRALDYMHIERKAIHRDIKATTL